MYISGRRERPRDQVGGGCHGKRLGGHEVRREGASIFKRDITAEMRGLAPILNKIEKLQSESYNHTQNRLLTTSTDVAKLGRTKSQGVLPGAWDGGAGGARAAVLQDPCVRTAPCDHRRIRNRRSDDSGALSPNERRTSLIQASR